MTEEEESGSETSPLMTATRTSSGGGRGCANHTGSHRQVGDGDGRSHLADAPIGSHRLQIVSADL